MYERIYQEIHSKNMYFVLIYSLKYLDILSLSCLFLFYKNKVKTGIFFLYFCIIWKKYAKTHDML